MATQQPAKRPARGEGKVQFALRIRPDLKHALEEEAYERDLSTTELVTRILSAWLRSQEPAKRDERK
jgi:predicted HicB family RNase H-like nuclease